MPDCLKLKDWVVDELGEGASSGERGGLKTMVGKKRVSELEGRQKHEPSNLRSTPSGNHHPRHPSFVIGNPSRGASNHVLFTIYVYIDKVHLFLQKKKKQTNKQARKKERGGEKRRRENGFDREKESEKGDYNLVIALLSIGIPLASTLFLAKSR